MKFIKKVVIVFIIMFLILPDKHVLSNNKIAKGYYDYSGKKGSNNIIMSIYLNNSKVAGLYAYKGTRKYIKLEGIIKDEKITLNELDQKGKIVGTFIGDIKMVDKINGTWSNGKTKKKFELKLVGIIYADYCKRFNLAGFSDEEVENFAISIQNYLAKNNTRALAKLIAYPVDVKIDGKIRTIKNEKEFINNFSKIFNANLKKAIMNAEPLFMFTNQYGAMLGDSGYNIWFAAVEKRDRNYHLLIHTINN
ncbi:hypothetical protein [Anaerocellum danielii]|uniref:Uncharacterized protein n=1 Tax=Anaerocellum danielii TaxID=1387557 RepID=A0ABZ0U7F8_9FIRM|nr:hypothetical protein [Caldicellulosiruptor danielii]WPX09665.1 hypothetical protein SOJ16_000898 [Caldicellulosiruptor danielii]